MELGERPGVAFDVDGGAVRARAPQYGNDGRRRGERLRLPHPLPASRAFPLSLVNGAREEGEDGEGQAGAAKPVDRLNRAATRPFAACTTKAPVPVSPSLSHGSLRIHGMLRR